MIIIMICLSILIFPLKQIFLLLSIELGIMNSCYKCSPNQSSKENCCNDSNASRIIHFIYRIIFAISEEVITGGRISLKICKIIRIKPSAPFGHVVSRLAIVEACFFVEIVTLIAHVILATLKAHHSLILF